MWETFKITITNLTFTECQGRIIYTTHYMAKTLSEGTCIIII